MSPFERILAAADTETLDLVRRMVGRETLALYLAKQIAASMNSKVDAEVVAEVFDIETESAYNKISKIDVIK